MRKNLLLKLFTLLIVLFGVISPSYALQNIINSLSSIGIEQAENNTYKLNLMFDSKYQGNAFIQKKGQGSYYIFLPETNIKSKKTKISYKNRKDKKNISVYIDEKPFISQNRNSSYVRLTVNAAEDYSLKIVSNVANSNGNAFTAFIKGLFKFIGILILAALSLMFIFKSLKSFNNEPSIDYKVRRKSRIQQGKRDVEKFEDDEEHNDMYYNNVRQNMTTPDTVNIRKTLETFADESFTCFDLAVNSEGNKNNYYEYKRAINNNSVLLSNPKIKSKLRHTNPLRQESILELPVAEDIDGTNDSSDKKTSPELISVLNITSNIGFYLTNVGETLALFGFVNDNIYLFKKFSDLSQINLQARFYDKHGNNDLYIVNLDTYKAMIEISPDGMKELAVL